MNTRPKLSLRLLCPDYYKALCTKIKPLCINTNRPGSQSYDKFARWAAKSKLELLTVITEPPKIHLQNSH